MKIFVLIKRVCKHSDIKSESKNQFCKYVKNWFCLSNLISKCLHTLLISTKIFIKLLLLGKIRGIAISAYFCCGWVKSPIYGKLASGAESHYEICCSFPLNVRTLHALESSSFIRFLFCLFRSSDLEFFTTLS